MSSTMSHKSSAWKLSLLLVVILGMALILTVAGQMSVAAQGEVVPAAITDTPTPTATPTAISTATPTPTPIPGSAPVAIPEPITILLFGGGVAAVSAAVAARRRRE